MRAYYIEVNGRMFRVEKGKETNVFLENRLLKSVTQDLPDEKIKEILKALIH